MWNLKTIMFTTLLFRGSDLLFFIFVEIIVGFVWCLQKVKFFLCFLFSTSVFFYCLFCFTIIIIITLKSSWHFVSNRMNKTMSTFAVYYKILAFESCWWGTIKLKVFVIGKIQSNSSSVFQTWLRKIMTKLLTTSTVVIHKGNIYVTMTKDI